jgi:predicted DNA-binding transcriptional regulator AlpA
MSRRRVVRRRMTGGLPPVIPAIDLITEKEACAIIGGSKPISRFSLYRGIAENRYPRGVRVAPNSVRYNRAEYVACIRSMIAARSA